MRIARQTIPWILFVAILAVPLFFGAVDHGLRADDAYRTTSLAVGGKAITATLNSTLSGDETWKVTWFHTPVGLAEYQYSAVSTSRTDGITSSDNLSAFVQVSSFATGDYVRAYFQSFDTLGTQTFAFSRIVQVP